jgi:hypothetical protein
MDTLLRMQTAFEIAEARDREADIKIRRCVPKRAERELRINDVSNSSVVRTTDNPLQELC